MNVHELMIVWGLHPNQDPPTIILRRGYQSPRSVPRSPWRVHLVRQVVELVGNLIDIYGYYDVGKTLLFADPKEGEVLEMCVPPKDTGDCG